MITTSAVTMRVNTKVLQAIKSEAKKSGKGYQTLINERLAKATGLTIPPVVRAPRTVKKVTAKPLVIKAAKKLKATKPKKASKAKKSVKAKSKKK